MAGCLAVLGALAACGTAPRLDQKTEAQQYLSKARTDYVPPGSAEDPWGPYITEASKRFDVPERWIREVMRVESGGRVFVNGSPITSPVGAMGLMQVMPGTFDELRGRYTLGDDPFNPHENIMAGAAYIREMYDIYGSPGFLAAYNAGPGRLDDYLTRGRPLPDETRRYVAKIGPYIADSWPTSRSPAEMYAMNAMPFDADLTPPAPRYAVAAAPRPAYRPQYAAVREREATRIAAAESARSWRHAPQQHHVMVAQVAEPPRRAAPQPVYQQVAMVAPPHGGMHLIGRANAAEAPVLHNGGQSGWAIQVGAYGNQGAASAATHAAQGVTTGGQAHVSGVRQGAATLYRARVTGMTRDAATRACERLVHGRQNCVVLSPGAQS